MKDDDMTSRERSSGIAPVEMDPEEINGSDDNEGGGIKMLLAAVAMIGIVAVSAEGAALCYRTICTEAPGSVQDVAPWVPAEVATATGYLLWPAASADVWAIRSRQSP